MMKADAPLRFETITGEENLESMSPQCCREHPSQREIIVDNEHTTPLDIRQSASVRLNAALDLAHLVSSQ